MASLSTRETYGGRASVRWSMIVRTITRQGFKLESPFLHRMCILGPVSALLKMGSIDLDLQGHFGLKWIDFRKFELVHTINRQFPYFAQNLDPGTLLFFLENGTDRP